MGVFGSTSHVVTSVMTPVTEQHAIKCTKLSAIKHYLSGSLHTYALQTNPSLDRSVKRHLKSSTTATATRTTKKATKNHLTSFHLVKRASTNKGRAMISRNPTRMSGNNSRKAADARFRQRKDWCIVGAAQPRHGSSLDYNQS